MRLRIGNTATSIGAKGAFLDGISWRQASNGKDLETQDEERHANSNRFDFVVSGLDHGASTLVVLPLLSRLQAGNDFRLRRQNLGWSPFKSNGRNQIYSARGTEGSLCPAPGSYQYGTGLASGSSCVQFLLEDGGSNDVDGRVNGSVAVLGAIFLPVSDRVYGRGDLLLTLLLASNCVLFWRRWRAREKACARPDILAD